MTECSNCGRNDGTHAPNCFRGWTVENAPLTYAQLAAENIDLRRQLAECQANAAPRDEIAQLYDAYAYAVAGNDNGEQFPALARWLGVL